jgi:predicted metal-dependent hydrolase
MATQIELGDITVDVVKKRIKNVYLRVYPPDGNVRVSAPWRMSLSAIRAFVISKQSWIEQQQHRIQVQAQRAAHMPQIQDSAEDLRRFRRHLEAVVPPLIAKWEPRMGVKVDAVSIRRMKTRWGSCSPHSRRIRLNIELAKKPPECLEYVVVHEMVHLLEPSHNHRFVALMDHFFKEWRYWRKELNR